MLYRLKDAGYQAFLVGGAVRDLLLGLHPKDFDVATNAHPDQVKQLFRNCRLIGRRFHLAHVRFGYEIIEVATFRAAHTPIDEDNSVDEGGHRVLDERGRILRDNLYGTIEEDVWRRDFTANALYYNIEDFSVWDYVGGVDDARARILRMIGDPETRYREDPVRMLRAVRFAAKLDFTIHADTAAPIPKLAWMLDGVPPARLFDEVNKLFLAGSAHAAFDLLINYGLLEHLFPDLADGAGGVAGRRGSAELLRLGLAGHRRARARGQIGDADIPVCGAAVAGDQRAYERAPQRDGDEIQAAARRMRAGDGAPAGAHRGAEALHAAAARDDRPAAALRASRRAARVASAGSSAFSRRLRFPAAARRGRRSRCGAGEMVDGHSDRPRPKSGSRASRAWRAGAPSAASDGAAPPSPSPPPQTARRVVNAAVWMPAYVAHRQQSRRSGAAGRRPRSTRSRLLDGCRLDRAFAAVSIRAAGSAGSARVRQCRRRDC